MKKLETINESVELFNKAVKAGEIACNNDKPTPMYVCQHKDVFDDDSPVETVYKVSDGMCGFAEVKIPFKTQKNRKFINDLKKQNIVGEDMRYPITKAYGGGFSYWVRQGNQSISRKEAFAKAMQDVLLSEGIHCYVTSRLD